MISELAIDDPLRELIDEFDELDDWEDRYELLIDLGRSLPEFPEAHRLDSNKVDGCMSTVWMVTQIGQPAGDGHAAEDTELDPSSRLSIHADSDSILVKGLIAVLLAVFNDRELRFATAFDVGELFQRLGLDQQLSPNRRNGLFSMVKRIRLSIATRS